MKEMELQREKKQAERNMTDSLINIKQKNFMQIVLFAMVKQILNEKVEKHEIREKNGDVVIKELLNVSAIEVCSLYCKYGMKFQIPLYSSMTIFQSVTENPECRSKIIAKILDESKLSEEEKLFSSTIELGEVSYDIM